MDNQPQFDPLTLEVLWQRLVSVVNEQAAALVRTSFTSIVRDSGDLSAGVFDRRGRMVAQAECGTPGHTNSMATCVGHFLRIYPIAALAPGDVLLTNDPWLTAGQLNDLTVVTPVFRGDRLVAFFGNTCHAIDIGGHVLSAESADVFEEGLALPIVKLYAAGQPNETLLTLLRANVRQPDMVLGDLHAQVVCNEVGAERLRAMLDEFELADLEALADTILDRSEEATRQAIARIPPGSYAAEIQSDGYDEPLRLRVTVHVEGRDIRVDYAGSSPQSQKGINVVFNYTHAYTTYAFKCALTPEIPNNAGSFRPIHVSAPAGCILNAQRPAAVGARHVVGHLLPGLLYHALAPAIPERVIAEGAGNIWMIQVSSQTGAAERQFTQPIFTAGGMGARPSKDGLSCVAFPSGILGSPVEAIEAAAPIVIWEKNLRPDSAGAGQYRGGFGQVIRLGVRTGQPWTLSSMFDRTQFPPRGLFGGHDGARGEIEVSTGARPPSKQQLHLGADETVTLRLPGGAGYGDPRARDPDAVRADVRAGLVSPAAARADYGVADAEADAKLGDQAD